MWTSLLCLLLALIYSSCGNDAITQRASEHVIDVSHLELFTHIVVRYNHTAEQPYTAEVRLRDGPGMIFDLDDQLCVDGFVAFVLKHGFHAACGLQCTRDVIFTVMAECLYACGKTENHFLIEWESTSLTHKNSIETFHMIRSRKNADL